MHKYLTLGVTTHNRTYCARPGKTEPGCVHLKVLPSHCLFWDKVLVDTKIGTYNKTCRCIECIDFEVAIDKAAKR